MDNSTLSNLSVSFDENYPDLGDNYEQWPAPGDLTPQTDPTSLRAPLVMPSTNVVVQPQFIPGVYSTIRTPTSAMTTPRSSVRSLAPAPQCNGPPHTGTTPVVLASPTLSFGMGSPIMGVGSGRPPMIYNGTASGFLSCFPPSQMRTPTSGLWPARPVRQWEGTPYVVASPSPSFGVKTPTTIVRSARTALPWFGTPHDIANASHRPLRHV